jgi:hypothetical protein
MPQENDSSMAHLIANECYQSITHKVIGVASPKNEFEGKRVGARVDGSANCIPR